MFKRIYKFIGSKFGWLDNNESRVAVVPWCDAHTGNFDKGEEAYTLLLDGKTTNISFALEEGDAAHPNYEHVTLRVSDYIAEHGIEVEPPIIEFSDEAETELNRD